METASNILPYDLLNCGYDDKLFFLKLLEEKEKGNARCFGIQSEVWGQKTPFYLVSFVYTTECQINNAWNEYNLRARGITFYVTFEPKFKVELVSNPFPKYFNIEQVPFTKQEEIIDNMNRGIGHIAEKEDGSLVILYYYDYRTFMLTKGSYESEQARMARAIWYNKYAPKYNMISLGTKSNITLLLELVGPSNKNVCRTKYKEDDLILLDIRYNKPMLDSATGNHIYSYSQKDFEEFATKLKITTPAVFAADMDVIDSVKNEEDPNFEGIIYKVNRTDDIAYKIKSNKYLSLHKILTGNITYGKILDIWHQTKLGKKLGETISDVPDEFYTEINQMTFEIEKEFTSMFDQTVIIFENMVKAAKTNNRKTLALAYPKHCYLLDKVFMAAQTQQFNSSTDLKSILINKFYIDKKLKKDSSFNVENPNIISPVTQ